MHFEQLIPPSSGPKLLLKLSMLSMSVSMLGYDKVARGSARVRRTVVGPYRVRRMR